MIQIVRKALTWRDGEVRAVGAAVQTFPGRQLEQMPDKATPHASSEALIAERIDSIEGWLTENAPYCAGDQRHLDDHTVERAYWHYGYLVALRDVKRLLANSA